MKDGKKKSVKEKIPCPVCGELFYPTLPTKIYCSRRCLRKMQYQMQKIGQKAPTIPRQIKCVVCGELFEPRSSGNQYCSKECLSKARNARVASSNRKGMIPYRACHDCGKPTYDYRCPECLEKWRRKHNVGVSSEEFVTYNGGEYT